MFKNFLEGFTLGLGICVPLTFWAVLSFILSAKDPFNEHTSIFLENMKNKLSTCEITCLEQNNKLTDNKQSIDVLNPLNNP